MLPLELIRSRLKNMTLTRVAEASGVTYGVVYNIHRGKSNPKYQSVKALSDYFTQLDTYATNKEKPHAQ